MSTQMPIKRDPLFRLTKLQQEQGEIIQKAREGNPEAICGLRDSLDAFVWTTSAVQALNKLLKTPLDEIKREQVNILLPEDTQWPGLYQSSSEGKILWAYYIGWKISLARVQLDSGDIRDYLIDDEKPLYDITDWTESLLPLKE